MDNCGSALFRSAESIGSSETAIEAEAESIDGRGALDAPWTVVFQLNDLHIHPPILELVEADRFVFVDGFLGTSLGY